MSLSWSQSVSVSLSQSQWGIIGHFRSLVQITGYASIIANKCLDGWTESRKREKSGSQQLSQVSVSHKCRKASLVDFLQVTGYAPIVTNKSLDG